MNDEFVTMGLQNDRYLKAIRLINDFETELRRELERVGNRIAEENGELFVDDVTPSWNRQRSSGTLLAFARVDLVMNRLSSVDEGARSLKLNFSFRWVEPAQLGHHDVDGALTVASYKIKRARSEDHERVVQRTREEGWPILVGEDHFDNAPGIFYIPVENAQELRDAHETLIDHFSAYGSMYGVEAPLDS